jgi:long-chain acyl-CoA synthetase
MGLEPRTLREESLMAIAADETTPLVTRSATGASATGFNLAAILHESALRLPDKIAVYSPFGDLTYAEIDERSDAVASNLRQLGIAAGDRVAIQLPNVPEFLYAHFGILKLGAVVVPLNPLLKEHEIAYHLEDSESRVLITWSGFADAAKAGAAAADVDLIFAAGEEVEGARPFAELLEPPAERIFELRSPADTAVVIYTSGTTGKPKGAELSHFSLYMNCDIPVRLVDFDESDVVIAVLPLFHVYGLSSVLHPAFRFGGAISLIPRFDAEAVLEAIARDRATFFSGVPTMYIALLEHERFDDFDISSLRIGVSGGASIPAEVLDEWERRVGVPILEGYGLSETASTTTWNPGPEERRVYSVGKPIWGVAVEIWDDEGEPLPCGREHVGEIVVRGTNVMTAYLGNPEATKEAFKGGWFHTGDLGYVDEDGFLFIVDRKKDLIIRGGYNVYPREVEEVLYTHPAVAEAAVVGVPHARLGEEVKAFVALRQGTTATADEIIEYAKERLAAYKYPRLVEFRDELPKGGSGKIVKTELGG